MKPTPTTATVTTNEGPKRPTSKRKAPSPKSDSVFSQSLADSLKSFGDAKQAEYSRWCWLCSIPERATIDAQRRADDNIRKKTHNRRIGISMRTIVTWLVEERGHSPNVATLGKIKSHFDRRHHWENADESK